MLNESTLKKYYGCLSHLKFNESNSKGRKSNDIDDYDGSINCFIADRFKLLESKALRRLEDKTQVFSITQDNKHIRSRSSHTSEVVAMSTKIALCLGLNRYLCEAIATGHDIGHVPFGHAGEKAIENITSNKFFHGNFGAIIAQEIERSGRGLNLTYETLCGIRHHSCADKDVKVENDCIAEFEVVKIADKIAYTFADANDTMRANLDSNLLLEIKKMLLYFGQNQRQRIAFVMEDILRNSGISGKLSFGESEITQKLNIFKKWMFDNVYHCLERDAHIHIISKVYEKLSELNQKSYEFKHIQVKKDFIFDPLLFIILLTDNELVNIYLSLVRKCSLSLEDIINTTSFEVISRIK